MNYSVAGVINMHFVQEFDNFEGLYRNVKVYFSPLLKSYEFTIWSFEIRH